MPILVIHLDSATSQIAGVNASTSGEVEKKTDKMADDELEAIRARRMAELQQQMGVRYLALGCMLFSILYRN